MSLSCSPPPRVVTVVAVSIAGSHQDATVQRWLFMSSAFLRFWSFSLKESRLILGIRNSPDKCLNGRSWFFAFIGFLASGFGSFSSRPVAHKVWFIHLVLRANKPEHQPYRRAAICHYQGPYQQRGRSLAAFFVGFLMAQLLHSFTLKSGLDGGK